MKLFFISNHLHVATSRCDIQNSPLFCLPGDEIPPQATLVFDVLLVDIHNPKDNITVENQVVPESCTRRSVVGDYIRYHYNGTFLNGVTFDTRSAHALLIWLQLNFHFICEIILLSHHCQYSLRFKHKLSFLAFLLSPATRGTALTTPTLGWGT